MLSKIFNKLAMLSCMILAGALLYGCNGGGTSAPSASNLGKPSAVDPTNIQATIQGVTINSPPVVTFTLLDESGAPLDPNVVIQSGGRVSFTIAQLGADGNYQNYIAAVPSGQPGFDTGGTFATVGAGVYTYTFTTNVRDATKTRKGLVFDPSLTHTVAAQIERTKGTLQQAVNPYLTFRPDGGTVAVTREVVAISNCNECHGKLGFHGGGRREIPLCILCHNPGVIDPITGNSIDMKSLIHKIHMGAKLPSNAAGGDFTIIDFQNIPDSFKTVGYPLWSGDSLITGTPIECTKCHRMGTDLSLKPFGKDADQYKANPTIAKCTTCHDTITFDGSGTVTIKNGINPVVVTAVHHTGGIQADGSCGGCHPAGTVGTDEFNATVVGAHTLTEKSSVFTGLNYQIISVINATAGQRPTVTFKITNNSGATVTVTPGSFNLKLGYMPAGSADYTNAGLLPPLNPNSNVPAGTRGALPNNPAQPLTMPLNLVAAATAATPFPSGLTANLTPNADGSYTVTFDETLVTNPLTNIYTGGVLTTTGTYAIPATATGIGVIGLEGRKGYVLPITPHRGATAKTVNIGGDSVQYYFDLATGAQVTDPAKQRRKSVDLLKCQKCHSRLVAHGGSRTTIGECVICHNPNATDFGSASRHAPNPPLADGLDQQSVTFQVMIHKIHTGEDLAFPYIISAGSFNEVRFPGVKGDCLACHINASPEPYILPLPANVLGTTTRTNSVTQPVGYVQTPEQSACTSCHDGNRPSDPTQTTQQHAEAGVSAEGIALCVNCHGAGGLKAVETIHPIIKR